MQAVLMCFVYFFWISESAVLSCRFCYQLLHCRPSSFSNQVNTRLSTPRSILLVLPGSQCHVFNTALLGHRRRTTTTDDGRGGHTNSRVFLDPSQNIFLAHPSRHREPKSDRIHFFGPVFGPFLERFRLENCQKGTKFFGALRAQKLEKCRGSINSSVRSWRNKKGSSG